MAADLVQNIYLNEVKAYRSPPTKASDAEGHVQKFAMPTAPASPEEKDLSKDLKEYETQAVDVEGQAAPGEAAPVHDWFEDPEEEEQPASH